MPTKMFLWAFSVVLHIAAILSLRENMSDRILLNSVPPYLKGKIVMGCFPKKILLDTCCLEQI